MRIWMKAMVIGGVMAFIALCVLAVLVLAPRPNAPIPDAVIPRLVNATGPNLDAIRQRGVLRVLMDTGTPAYSGSSPTYVINAKGEADGFDLVVARAIAHGIGVPEVKLEHALYSEITGRFVGTASTDVLISGFIPDGSARVSWSEPYLELGLCLMVRSTSKIRGVKDLVNKRVGVFDDEAARASVQGLVKGYKELVSVEQGYLDLLLQGDLDAFIYDQPYAVAEIKELYQTHPHHKGALRIAQYNLTEEVYAVGVRSDQPDLLAAVNEAIATLRTSPAYDAALKAWIASEVADVPVAGQRTEAVREGDTLATIAQRTLHDKGRWPEIWALNKDRFPNPTLVSAGDIVVVPAP